MIIEFYKKCRFRRDESLPSFVSRFALHTRIRSTEELCRSLGFPSILLGQSDPYVIEKVSKLTGVSATSLWRAALHYENKRLYLGNERITRRLLRSDHVYACPACLRDDKRIARPKGEPTLYGRTEWLLSVFRACPYHAIALVPIATMPDGGIGHGHDFARIFREHKPPLRKLLAEARYRGPSRLETYVRNRLHGTAEQAEYLDQMELYAAIMTCEMLGLLLISGPTTEPYFTSEKDWHRAGDVGYGFARDGARGFQNAFDDVRRYRLARTDASGWPEAAFGFFYNWLEDYKNDVTLDIIRAQLQLHVQQTMSVERREIILAPNKIAALNPIWATANEN